MKITNFCFTATFLIFSQIKIILCEQTEGGLIYCKTEICNSTGGVCNKEGHCQCYFGYLTPNHLADHIKCNYKQISSMKAGLLEILLGCGFGHFYSGRTINGWIKLICTFIFCGGLMTSVLFIRKIRQEVEAEDHSYISLFIVSMVIFKVIVIVWQMVDGILFFFKVYKDGHGFELI